MTNEPRPRAAVLTVSDAGSRGERVDTAGPACVELLRGAGFEVVFTSVVADEPEESRRTCAAGRTRSVLASS